MAVKKELRAIISADDRAFQRTVARVKKAALNTARSLAQISVAGGVAFLAGSKVALDYADNIDKLALRLGVTTDEYQRLSLAAAQAGLSQEQFNVGMQALTKNIGGALQGEMGQVRALRQIGISLRDIRGKSAQEQLMMVGDALSRVADQNKRMKLAGQLFGDEAGARFMVMFAKGAAGVADAMNRIDGNSLLTPEQIQNATRLNDQLTITKAVLMGGLASLLADTWPKMESGIANATAELQAFVRSAEFDAIRDQLNEIIVGMVALSREVLPLVKTGMEGLAELNAFAKPIEGLKELIGLLNDLNELTQRASNENLEEGIFLHGKGQTAANSAKEEFGLRAAQAFRFFGGGMVTRDARKAAAENISMNMDAIERATDKLIAYLNKGPLGEGK